MTDEAQRRGGLVRISASQQRFPSYFADFRLSLSCRAQVANERSSSEATVDKEVLGSRKNQRSDFDGRVQVDSDNRATRPRHCRSDWLSQLTEFLSLYRSLEFGFLRVLADFVET